ncbi:uncharacterized protein I206_106675 [Kwoniella pini CBS 10737]|uniref:Vacuolar protein sorting-associated protein 51 homolog n=1 Tax=Kwoniella pini CBS 10737 TaxID=1296096 RepID=A0A1B9HTI3_9TREE|nr:uncharacterized protein I206_07435 [Kwoniella pini CBS 10737]OCF46582.1 hypothetical protein I206_07435 [Kwoniella pini CBS 10737]
MATSSPIPRRHSEMPSRPMATPPRKISTYTDGGGSGSGSGSGEMKRLDSGLNNEQRKARREQFRNFYGIKDGSTPSSPSSNNIRQGERGNPTDIDSTSFNASAYYEELISKSNLKELMETASKLNGDIGNLEGSRHSLVYNHHHQLFSAGDTISKLNSRTPQLISIVSQLQESFSNIEQLINSLSLDESNISIDDSNDLDNNLIKLRNEKEKIKLMILAKEPIEKIKDYYEKLKQDIQDDEKEQDGSGPILKEIEKLLEDKPEQANDSTIS